MRNTMQRSRQREPAATSEQKHQEHSVSPSHRLAFSPLAICARACCTLSHLCHIEEPCWTKTLRLMSSECVLNRSSRIKSRSVAQLSLKCRRGWVCAPFFA
jgi:hypothetical protein